MVNPAGGRASTTRIPLIWAKRDVSEIFDI
jgi:hypothetical protein